MENDTRAAAEAAEEPTQLSDPLTENETQSINAWSLADDADDVAAYHPSRGWRVPIIVAAAVLVVLGGVGAYMVWGGHHDAQPQKPTAAPAPPPLPTDPDQRLIALLKQRGYKDVDPMLDPQLIATAHTYVDAIAEGSNRETEIDRLMKASPAWTREATTKVVDAIIDVYHPKPGIHYIETETYSDGVQDSKDWFVTSCGDGCMHVAELGGDAHLVDGKWTMNVTRGVTCNGANAPTNADFVFVWDPQSLSGAVTMSSKDGPLCGAPSGTVATNKMQLTAA